MDSDKLFKHIAKKLDFKFNQVKNLMELLDNDNTVPFIARYRKEKTGQLDEQQIRAIQKAVENKRNLEEKREDVLKKIDEQDKLTDELKAKIETAKTIQELDDIYRPFRPKRRTRAEKARKKGLEPLANLILLQKTTTGTPEGYAVKFIDEEKGVETVEDALQGAKDIVAETVSDDADLRKLIREYSFKHGYINSTAKKSHPKGKYEVYEDYSEPVSKIPSHRVLAINRGENEDYLRVKVEVDEGHIIKKIENKYIKNKKSIFTGHFAAAIEDGYKRLISPSIEREIRNHLTDKGERKAIEVFSENLKNLLLQPPLKDQIIMGIDPGFRTGCKVAVIDKTGKYLAGKTIYPHPPQKRSDEAKGILAELVEKYNVTSIAIGNGTASRETEQLVADLLKELRRDDLGYIIVNEAGASVYSASTLARKEFPDLEASMRGNISIARRLLDPLAELVKINPKHIGVGQYQHDVNQKNLNQELRNVVEDCVNSVGVNLNTASSALLRYVSGLSSRTAKNIIKYREEQGEFESRSELQKVRGIGVKTFQQAAGFLRVPESDNPFDNTFIHPESYSVTENLFDKFNIDDVKLGGQFIDKKLQQDQISITKLAQELDIGVPTLKDIIKNLKKPGLDPRDKLPKPILSQKVLSISDLQEGMVLTGTVRNVVDFGAFVDIGVKQDGLVHISELSNDFVKDPSDVVSVGDVVEVEVMSIDETRGRIGLSIKRARKR